MEDVICAAQQRRVVEAIISCWRVSTDQTRTIDPCRARAGVTVDVPWIINFNHPGGGDNIYVQLS